MSEDYYVLRRELKETSNHDGTVEFSDSSTSRQSISLKRNGTELDISKSINSIVSAAKNIKTTFDTFKNAVPKIGWQADLDIAILEGSITGTWGVAPNAKPEHTRIWRVKDYYSIKVDCKIIEVKAEIGFGVDFRVDNWFSSAPLAEIVLKISGSLTISAAVSAEFSTQNKGKTEEKFVAKTVPALKAIARASIVGYAAEASVSVDCGIQVSGSFMVSVQTAPCASLKVEWLPVSV